MLSFGLTFHALNQSEPPTSYAPQGPAGAVYQVRPLGIPVGFATAAMSAIALGYAGASIWTVPGLLLAPGLLGRLPLDAGLGILLASMVNIYRIGFSRRKGTPRSPSASISCAYSCPDRTQAAIVPGARQSPIRTMSMRSSSSR